VVVFFVELKRSALNWRLSFEFKLSLAMVIGTIQA